jgi:MOSC domain-containing protein YiiM
VRGTIHQINISKGGVPKLPVGEAEVTSLGIIGDGHDDRVHHGGPQAALCLFSLEVIEALQAEGHPIFPGAAGENLTIAAIDWDTMVPGTSWRLGDEVRIEISGYTTPCSKNAGWFLERDFMRMHQGRHPGSSRVYARVLSPGRLRPGDAVVPIV